MENDPKLLQLIKELELHQGHRYISGGRVESINEWKNQKTNKVMWFINVVRMGGRVSLKIDSPEDVNKITEGKHYVFMGGIGETKGDDGRSQSFLFVPDVIIELK